MSGKAGMKGKQKRHLDGSQEDKGAKKQRVVMTSAEEAPPKTAKTPIEKESAKRLIVVLTKACLETVKAGNSYELLNCDDHINILRKHKRDPAEVRPDICHQMLLSLMDSPLNKSGKLQVFIHTENNILIEVSPHVRIPRTYKRFAGLMVQLLHKLKIRASNGPETLLKVIKNPVEAHLPASAPRYGTSKTGDLVNVREWVANNVNTERPIVFVLGAMAHGKAEVDYVEKYLSFSSFPLSGSVAAGKLCSAFEEAWGIL